MKRSVCLLVLAFLLAACGTATQGPTTVPASPTPILGPTDTLVPASPTPVPEPTDTSPPPSPTPVQREPAWWDDTVFYEIFVRSFYDTDGDGIGDLAGVIEKLDYLQDLGVTGLWLMPIFVSPSYHGYDVVDYYTVNPDYGTNDDFVRLMDEAHQRGMRVIMDLVLNHTSDQHPWFVESASGPDSERRDWYIWSDTDPGYLGPWGEPVWHYRNGAYYYGVFWSGMPDLDLENQAVTAELYDVARYWLEEMGADGFRLDAVRHYIEDGKEQTNTQATHAWLQDFRAFCKQVSPDMVTVGEIWDVSDLVATYVGSDVDMAFEFSLAKAILLSVSEGGGTALSSAMKEVQRLFPAGGYAPFLTNHDQNRVMDELGRDLDRAKLAATALLTLPGVPFVYYGEEIGMTGSKPDELIRTPMQWTSGANAGFTTGDPWEPVNWGYEGVNVAVQSEDPGSLLNRYRALIGLRGAHPALRSLNFQPFESAERFLYAYLRHVGGDAILVVLNFGDSVATEVSLGAAKSPLPPGHYAAVDLLSGEQIAPLTVEAGGGVSRYEPLPELPARSALVLQLEAGEP